MGGCSSKRIRTGASDSYIRKDSALNARVYRTTNPTALVSTATTKNSASQARPAIRRQQQCEVYNIGSGANAKQTHIQTTHEGVKTSSEAHKIPIQKTNSVSVIDTAVDLNQSSKFAEANLVKAVANTSKKSELPNFNSYATLSTTNTKNYSQMQLEKKTVGSASHTSENKLNKNAHSHAHSEAMHFENMQTTWAANRRIIIIENSNLKSKAYDRNKVSENSNIKSKAYGQNKVFENSNLESKAYGQNKVFENSNLESKAYGQNRVLSIKNNAAGPLKLRKAGKSKNKKTNNHVAKQWKTQKNNRNEFYINRKEMKEFFELLKCPVCYQQIHGQIQKCVVGHFICAPCRSKLDRDRCPICQSEMSEERMITLQNMIGVISVQCPYHKFGCRHTANSMEMQLHMENCPYRVISCVDAKCRWEGKLEHIAFHFAKQHSDNVFQPSDELSIRSTKQDYTHNCLVRLHYRHNFFCRFKVCNAANALSIALQCVPTPRFKMEQWSYRLTLFAGVKRTLYSDLKVHEFKNTDSLNLADKSLILPLNEIEVFEVDGSIKWKIWFTKLDSEAAKPAVDGYCDVRNVPADRKKKSENCEMRMKFLD